jgi:hypothetical protein
MALTRTTLSSAFAVGDLEIVVASATGFAAGSYVRIDDEMFLISSSYVSGTSIPVRGGIQGTVQKAHQSGAGVVVGLATDFDDPAVQTDVPYPIAGRARRIDSYSASGAITLPKAGEEVVAVLNGTSVLAMTVAIPTVDMDGAILWIAGNGAAAHTVTFATGLSGAGASYDVVTVNADSQILLGPIMAINDVWLLAVATPMAGTVTNITGTVG